MLAIEVAANRFIVDRAKNPVLALGALHVAQVAQPIDELVGTDGAVPRLPGLLVYKACRVHILAASKHASKKGDLLLGTQLGRRSGGCGWRGRGPAVDPSELFSRLGKPRFQVRPRAVELAQVAFELLYASFGRVAPHGWG